MREGLEKPVMGTLGNMRQKPHTLTNMEVFQCLNNWYFILSCASPAWKSKYRVSNPFLEGRDATNHFVFLGLNMKTLWHPPRDIAKEKSSSVILGLLVASSPMSCPTLHVGIWLCR